MASTSSQPRIAAAVATMVLRKALTAVGADSRLDPALKPNQPNHSNAAPSMHSGTLWGAMASLP